MPFMDERQISCFVLWGRRIPAHLVGKPPELNWPISKFQKNCWSEKDGSSAKILHALKTAFYVAGDYRVYINRPKNTMISVIIHCKLK